MKKLIYRRYDIESEKIPEGRKVRLCLIADLHGAVYGENQEKLVRIIRIHRPDAVLAAGDLVTSGSEASLEAASLLLRRLCRFVPVYYSMGNHELAFAGKKVYQEKNRHLYQAYAAFEEELKRAGVFVLHDERKKLIAGPVTLDIAGLDLEFAYYRKLVPKRLSSEDITQRIGEPDPDAVQVLMAHSPRFADAYYDWGGDLTVSGHYHGGMIRLNEHCGLVSPYFTPFPRYCVGGFAREDQYLIVSPGLGNHSIQLRIHNPEEISMITLMSIKENGDFSEAECV